MEQQVIQSVSAYKKTLNYLIFTLNFNKHQANSIINRYAKAVIGITKPDEWSLPQWYLHVGKDIQNNWQMFMQFYGSIKSEYPQQRPIQRDLKNEDYERFNAYGY